MGIEIRCGVCGHCEFVPATKQGPHTCGNCGSILEIDPVTQTSEVKVKAVIKEVLVWGPNREVVPGITAKPTRFPEPTPAALAEDVRIHGLAP